MTLLVHSLPRGNGEPSRNLAREPEPGPALPGIEADDAERDERDQQAHGHDRPTDHQDSSHALAPLR
ncbi:MAG: hypothetical protein DMD86_17245 [Candidatus Rokuibacteriota bacterium]|nr:MAG: hypothetical protein DMD86_17245 [Candidatus Rokubacteria bacterium]